MRVDETEGILQVGEVSVIVRRDSPREADHSQAFRSGAERAYRDALLYVAERIEKAPPYTDTRALSDMIVFLTDRIQEVAADARTSA